MLLFLNCRDLVEDRASVAEAVDMVLHQLAQILLDWLTSFTAINFVGW